MGLYLEEGDKANSRGPQMAVGQWRVEPVFRGPQTGLQRCPGPLPPLEMLTLLDGERVRRQGGQNQVYTL